MAGWVPNALHLPPPSLHLPPLYPFPPSLPRPYPSGVLLQGDIAVGGGSGRRTGKWGGVGKRKREQGRGKRKRERESEEIGGERERGS